MRYLHAAALGGLAALVLIGATRVPENFGPLGGATVRDEGTLREDERRRALDQAFETLTWVREQRSLLLRDLVDGNVDLSEEIRRFLALNRYDRVSWNYLRSSFPGHADEEVVGYQILVAAHAQAWRNAEEKKTFERKLLDQLTDRFGERLVLPAHVVMRRR